VKILVADQDGTRAVALAAQLQAQDETFSISLLLDDEILLHAVRRAAPDILNSKPVLPVIMFVDDEDPAFMEEAIAAGVSSYHVTGADLPAIKPILRTATAFFKRTQHLSARLAEAEEQIAARQAIDAAKRLLMTREGMSEPTAHRFLQRRAMDSQKKLADIAAQMLRDDGSTGKTEP
jgi:response regulator NasT